MIADMIADMMSKVLNREQFVKKLTNARLCECQLMKSVEIHQCTLDLVLFGLYSPSCSYIFFLRGSDFLFWQIVFVFNNVLCHFTKGLTSFYP